MKRKFSSEQRHRHSAEQQLGSKEEAREFATPEELLRYDAAQTGVPPAIAQRLQRSSAGITPPGQPWWKRLFKR